VPRSRSRSLALIGLSSALVVSLAACADSTSASGGGSGSSGTASSGKSIIVVTPNPIGGNNFLELAIAGAKRVAADEHASIEVYESTDPTSIQQNVEAAVRKKPTVVVGLSFSLQDVFSSVPADHPDQQFLLVDACPEKPAPNVTCAAFREQEAAYLAGVEVGMLTKSNQVGVVAALDSPFIRRWVDPFAAGAKSVNPSVTSTGLFVGGANPFGDPARGKAQAQVLADKGADYVEAAASGSNVGVFELAKAGKFTALGVDVNECASAPGHVLDNVLKNVDVALEQAVKAILAGQPGGSKVYGLAEGGVGVTALTPDVASSGCLIADHPDVIKKVAEVKQQIIDGTVKVPDPLTQG
jgi:basic membrane protein A